MTDLNKERELFEATRVGEFKNVEFVVNEHWPEGHYVGKTSHYEDQDDAHYLSQSWYSWIDRAKIEAKAQAVLETQQKLTDTYYLEGSDYVVDCPFEYDIEIDKGEVLELQKWQRTDSTKVYFANIYKDEDNFEILQFASKAEAENAVAENLKFLEASESGAEQ
ncbi:hypothetical protein [Acinetobacter nosocomialis]|uniref:hypothetical protein n=1 Tax=Acinetobacter nosocomialis TaxID=106654 RepID=UPI000DE76ED5|nr:hypothetical protein [Acinetobacter nosocomialis]SSV40301.1 Uncharacterised protein [Acinetobacter nosocomialis]